MLNLRQGFIWWFDNIWFTLKSSVSIQKCSAPTACFHLRHLLIVTGFWFPYWWNKSNLLIKENEASNLTCLKTEILTGVKHRMMKIAACNRRGVQLKMYSADTTDTLRSTTQLTLGKMTSFSPRTDSCHTISVNFIPERTSHMERTKTPYPL